MRVNILKYVLFSIIICFFEYGKNVSYILFSFIINISIYFLYLFVLY
ncbi:hypothetical protein AC239_26970 [Bacteroides fragilis]|nr:hypothetical protein AC239_26970 [Bacteroides fragilis]